MKPLRIKASGSPITASNFEGLQTISATELKNYTAHVITSKFATDTDGTGTAELNITTDNSGTGTSIGTFVDTTRPYTIGQHPVNSATINSTTYYAKQVTASASGSVTNRPVGWDSGIKELSDTNINEDILDDVIAAMVAENNHTCGLYKMQSSAPSGGTWVSRYTITDTAIGGNTTTYLWQKTVATSPGHGDEKILKLYNTSNVREMSDSELEQMVPAFRNRIISTGIGTYKLQTSAPTPGTWVQSGNTFSDTREQVQSQNYSGSYSGQFAGAYAGNYVGTSPYSGVYTGAYAGTYGTAYTGSYAGNYNTAYTGVYNTAFAGSYNALTYSGAYAGNYNTQHRCN